MTGPTSGSGALRFAEGIVREELDSRFLACLQWFAEAVAAHRYATQFGIYVLVTSGYRPGDTKTHGKRGGADIRGRFMPEDPDTRRKLELWLAALWGEATARLGYAPGQWGFGAYDDDRHYHLDVRLGVSRDQWAAVWVGR